MSDFHEWTIPEFVDLIVPRKDEIEWKPNVKYDTNNILWNSNLLYGDKRKGKTELARMLAEQAVGHLGPNIEGFMLRGKHAMDWLSNPFMDAHGMKVYFFDDMTGQKMNKSQVENWFGLAHIMKNRIHASNGLLMTFLATHDYFALDKRMRIGFNCLMCTSLTTNPYDLNWLTRMVGTEGVSMLHHMAMNQLLHKPYERVVVFRVLDIIGYFKTQLANVNYFTDWAY